MRSVWDISTGHPLRIMNVGATAEHGGINESGETTLGGVPNLPAGTKESSAGTVDHSVEVVPTTTGCWGGFWGGCMRTHPTRE